MQESIKNVFRMFPVDFYTEKTHDQVGSTTGFVTWLILLSFIKFAMTKESADLRPVSRSCKTVKYLC
jgi:hypothetical protein